MITKAEINVWNVYVDLFQQDELVKACVHTTPQNNHNKYTK